MLDSFDESTGVLTATVPITNHGSAPGVTEVSLTADGATLQTQTVTVQAGETATMTFTETVGSSETVALQLGGQSIGEVTLLAEEEPTIEDAPVHMPDVRGEFLIGLLLFVGLVMALTARGRRPTEAAYA